MWRPFVIELECVCVFRLFGFNLPLIQRCNCSKSLYPFVYPSWCFLYPLGDLILCLFSANLSAF
uniref:Uncharacterized protein n=1 Tax=Rhizophora mucronata TaxID=61149 RepID=A0A2P2IVS7_RHIMU